MDEEAVHQQRFREADEASTAKRALILGVPYRDMTNEEATIPLIQGMMEISDMYRYKMIPLAKGSYITPSIYGITLDTPESRLKEINAQAERDSESVRYEVISNSSFRNIMRRYDPPKNVVYHDVQISSEGDSDTIHKVSIELDEVRPDDILNYLILQADKLGASDIHLEHQRDQVRVRFRIDGALHPVATLSHDKYRVLFSSIASAANLSTAAMEAQSGHIVREIGELRKSFQLLDKSGQVYQAEADDHTLNMRIETVPTMYGQDAVIRLFNFRSEMLSLDVLGLDDKEMVEFKEIISHPHGMVMVVGGLFFNGLWRAAIRNRRCLKPEVPDDVVRAMTRRFAMGPLLYAIAAAVSVISAWLSVATYLLLIVLYTVESSWRRNAGEGDGEDREPRLPADGERTSE